MRADPTSIARRKRRRERWAGKRGTFLQTGGVDKRFAIAGAV
jgi:hypothetical protein